MSATEISYASPAHCPPGNSTRTRHRRTHRSTTDKLPPPTTDGFIEEAYRAGGPFLSEAPALETPLPANHILTERLSNGAIKNGVIDIVRKRNVDFSDVRFVLREPRFSDLRKRTPVPTVLIECTRTGSEECPWIDVVRAVRVYLCERGYSGVCVEMVDGRFDAFQSVFPCELQDEVFPVWEEVCREIVSGWDLAGVICIGCFRCGWSERSEECVPTVLVSVESGMGDWRALRERIVSVLDGRGLGMVAVRIREDMELREVETRVRVSARDCLEGPGMGSSLSVRAEKEMVGTLGAWMELKMPGRESWTRYALTCNNCVISSYSRAADELKECKYGVEHSPQWEYNGVPIDDPNRAEYLAVDSPSQSEVMKSVEAHRQSIENIMKGKEYTKLEYDANIGIGLLRRERTRWKAINCEIQQVKNDMLTLRRHIHAKKHNLGVVFTSSYLPKRSQETVPDTSEILSSVDWALIEPFDSSKTVVNSVHTYGPVTIQDTKLDTLSILPAEESLIGQRLMKVGQRTGLTSGLYGGLRAILPCGVQVNGKKHCIPAWVHTTIGSPVDTPFHYAGDSGSLFFTEKGQVAGMLFAGSSIGNIGYFTHIQDVLEDIRAVTKAEGIRIRSKGDGYDVPSPSMGQRFRASMGQVFGPRGQSRSQSSRQSGSESRNESGSDSRGESNSESQSGSKTSV